MSESTAFPAPLELTEKAKTPSSSMRVVLDIYPSGALSVTLVPDAKATHQTSIMLSVDYPKAKQLARGEFVAACEDPELARALLRGGLFRDTGRRLAEHVIWSLDGLTMIEFHSAFRPSLAASRVSFPAHLFEDKEFGPEARKRLIQTFETDGYTRHSARGSAVQVLRSHCETQKIPFIVYLLKDQDIVTGVLVCKRTIATALANLESGQGHAVQMVYESPAYA